MKVDLTPVISEFIKNCQISSHNKSNEEVIKDAKYKLKVLNEIIQNFNGNLSFSDFQKILPFIKKTGNFYFIKMTSNFNLLSEPNFSKISNEDIIKLQLYNGKFQIYVVYVDMLKI